MSKFKMRRLTPAKEKKLVSAICVVNEFFMSVGLPAPIDQSAALVISRHSEQGPDITRALIEGLVRTEPKPLTKLIQ